MQAGLGENLIACLRPEYVNDLIILGANPNSTNIMANSNLKCYLSCVATKMGMYDKTTGWNVDYIVEHSDEKGDSVRADVEKCIEQYSKVTDECEMIAQVILCLETPKANVPSTS